MVLHNVDTINDTMYYERLARSEKRFEASNSGRCLKNLPGI